MGVLLSLVIAGYSSDSSDDLNVSVAVSTPITISGKSIKGTITSGTSAFASSGRSMFVTSSSDNKYKVLGDGINIINAKGTFTNTASNNKPTIAFDDSLLGNETIILRLPQRLKVHIRLNQSKTL
jgi:hypothetical protein